MIDHVPSYFHGAKRRKARPYVGITGLATTWDVEESIDYFYKYRGDGVHVLMTGFLLSWKTLHLGKHPEVIKRKSYPDLPTMIKLLESAEYEDVFRVIHYNTKSVDLYEETSHFLGDLGWNAIVDGVQLNVRFPPGKEQVDMIVNDFPKIQVIIQVNKDAMERHHDFTGIADAISTHAVDYVLIDPSGGTGAPIDVPRSIMLYNLLRSRINATIGFAGGFTPENVASRMIEYKKSLDNGEEFCIDAESGLMDPAAGMNMKKVKLYLQRFFSVM